MSVAIEVTGVSKSFRRYRPDRPYTLQEVLARGVRGFRGMERFWALRDVSFSVPRGRAVGIIGTNGSGKSTLLRLVGGIGRPDHGRIAVEGRIGTLLDLGSGFHPDLSGRENVIIGGVLAGLTRQEVLRRFDEIVEFSGVRDFIDNPVRTYSSGMHMRLAFSTAAHTNPELLVIDEVLAVGDAAFQRKCLARIREFKAAGCSILLVSHGLAAVQSLCDELIWMNNGRLMAHGPIPEVVQQYEAHVGYSMEPARIEEAAAAPATPPPVGPVQSPVRITGVGLLDGDGHPVAEFRAGQALRVAIDFDSADVSASPRFRVRVVRQDGLVCCDVFDAPRAPSATAPQGGGRRTLLLDRLDLNSGHYHVDVSPVAEGVVPAGEEQAPGCALVVVGGSAREAVLDVPHRWELDA